VGYRPPKGVRPPQLEGKRTGRPEGSTSFGRAWDDFKWGLAHCDDPEAPPPSKGAELWRAFARRHRLAMIHFAIHHHYRRRGR
jgi:hypothetical protein